MFNQRQKLKDAALGGDILSNDIVIDSIDRLVELGDCSILQELLAQQSALAWTGPIHDGMESIAHQYGKYNAAVQRMENLAASQSTKAE